MSRPIHCIFRRNNSWLALSATAVREALPCPKLVAVPRTPAVFAGLCHVRSEFIPVLNPDLGDPVEGTDSDRVMLVIEDADSCWGLLVDQVLSLATLEFSDAPEGEDSVATAAVIGWATHLGQVVQLLDTTRLRELAERELAAGCCEVAGTDPMESGS